MLTIGDINYDDYVVISTYSANQVDEYGDTEYQDGWWKKHRTIARKRISATVTLAFKNAEDYNDFVANTLDDVGTDGDHTVTLYVNNLNQEVTINAYVAWETQTAIATPAFDSVPVFFNAVLTIEER